MVASGVMEDYTYLWYDVRPHPNLGTVEIRCCDSQTRVEHTVALTALIQAMVHELAEHYDAGTPLARLPVADARREQVARGAPRPRGRDRRPAVQREGRDEGADPPAARAPDAARRRTSARADALDGIRDLLERGNGASRQIVVYEANHDLNEVMAEIIAATARVNTPTSPSAPGGSVESNAMSQPDLFVVCKNCQAEVSPYVTECPYCGTRLRKRAPKIERPDAPPRQAARGARSRGAGARRPPEGSSRRRSAQAEARQAAPRHACAAARSPASAATSTASRGRRSSSSRCRSASGCRSRSTRAPTSRSPRSSADPWLLPHRVAVNDGTAAQFAVVVGLGLFGWLIERRHGPIAVVAAVPALRPGGAGDRRRDRSRHARLRHQRRGARASCAPGSCRSCSRASAATRTTTPTCSATLVIAAVLLLVPVLSQGSALAGRHRRRARRARGPRATRAAGRAR